MAIWFLVLLNACMSAQTPPARVLAWTQSPGSVRIRLTSTRIAFVPCLARQGSTSFVPCLTAAWPANGPMLFSHPGEERRLQNKASLFCHLRPDSYAPAASSRPARSIAGRTAMRMSGKSRRPFSSSDQDRDGGDNELPIAPFRNRSMSEKIRRERSEDEPENPRNGAGKSLPFSH